MCPKANSHFFLKGNIWPSAYMLPPFHRLQGPVSFIPGSSPVGGELLGTICPVGLQPSLWMAPSPPFPNSALLCSLRSFSTHDSDPLCPAPALPGVSPCRSTRQSWGLPSRLPLSPIFPAHRPHHSPAFPSFPVPTLVVPCSYALPSPGSVLSILGPHPGVLRKTGLPSLPDLSSPFRVPTLTPSAQLRSGLQSLCAPQSLALATGVSPRVLGGDRCLPGPAVAWTPAGVLTQGGAGV